MNSIIALVYLSVAVILIVFGVKQIKNRKNLRKINQKQEDEVKEKIKLGILQLIQFTVKEQKQEEYFMKCRRI